MSGFLHSFCLRSASGIVASISGVVWDIGVLQLLDDFLWQLQTVRSRTEIGIAPNTYISHNLYGVHARDIALEPLISSHPGFRVVDKCNESFEYRRGAVIDLFGIALEADSHLTVGASFANEFLSIC